MVRSSTAKARSSSKAVLTEGTTYDKDQNSSKSDSLLYPMKDLEWFKKQKTTWLDGEGVWASERRFFCLGLSFLGLILEGLELVFEISLPDFELWFGLGLLVEFEFVVPLAFPSESFSLTSVTEIILVIPLSSSNAVFSWIRNIPTYQQNHLLASLILRSLVRSLVRLMIPWLSLANYHLRYLHSCYRY